jgi:hypothetical protein
MTHNDALPFQPDAPDPVRVYAVRLRRVRVKSCNCWFSKVRYLCRIWP